MVYICSSMHVLYVEQPWNDIAGAFGQFPGPYLMDSASLCYQHTSSDAWQLS